MDNNGTIFLIIIMFYLCVVFPIQMRHYLLKRRRRLAQLDISSSNLVSNNSWPLTLNANNLNRNTNNRSEDTREPPIFNFVRMPPPGTDVSRWDADNAAARHQENEHRQQIIDIQREVEEQAIRRREERQPHPNAPHMPVRLINSSTVRSSAFTISISNHMTGMTNSSINYPNAPPPLSPLTDNEGMNHLRIPSRLDSKDDGLPSYDQAVAYDSTTTSVSILRRY